MKQQERMFCRATDMRNKIRWVVLGLLCVFGAATASDAQPRKTSVSPISWSRCLSQRAEFYAGDEAVRIADNVLLYQRETGGWQKNVEMASVLSEKDKAGLRRARIKNDSTLDNGATRTQMRYLAMVYQATGIERFKDAFLKAVDYLLEAQYANGGWPQFYPNPTGYSKHITFNDGTMIGVLNLLGDIAGKKPPYTFVDEVRRRRAETAVQKGIECILKCQIVVDGRKTAWCAQHDEKTFVPRKARSYELPSISGAESVGVVRFLMSVDDPGPRLVEAVQSAIAWFEAAKLSGIRQIRRPDSSKPRGYDKVIVEDPKAPPMWARFYEIGTSRPIFCGRDGKVKYCLAEIEHERRVGYSWYGDGPANLLARDYPAWQKKWAPEKNVLEN